MIFTTLQNTNDYFSDITHGFIFLESLFNKMDIKVDHFNC